MSQIQPWHWIKGSNLELKQITAAIWKGADDRFVDAEQSSAKGDLIIGHIYVSVAYSSIQFSLTIKVGVINSKLSGSLSYNCRPKEN